MTQAPFIDAVRKEVSALENSLSGDVRYVRLEALKAVLAEYQPTPRHPTNATARPRRPHRVTAGLRERALEFAQQLLEGRTELTSTSEIMEHITGMGLVIPGANPASNLSAMLSRSPHFVANGRKGWTLVADNEKPPPPE